MPLDTNVYNSLASKPLNTPATLCRTLAYLTSISTLFLIFIGGLVKSTESGLAVPDWPLSYGMLFPPMVGGVFYEHGHRMAAACVGLLMLALAIALSINETRKWVKVLGWCCFATVLLQGLLGGLTVLLFLPTPVSVLHGVLAQTFFVLTIFLAYSQSWEYQMRYHEVEAPTNSALLKLSLVFIILVFAQLVIGAFMRHTGSGLAIPDFLTTGGMWVPLFNENMLAWINDWQFEHNRDFVTMGQVWLHFAHRAGAVVILLAVLAVNKAGLKENKGRIKNTLLILDHLLVAQIFLGIISVLTIKEPVTTSIHVTLGAGLLGLSVLLLLRSAPVRLEQFKLRVFS